MRCHKCGMHKLRKEFPHEALTENCEHAPLHCLRCTTEHVEKHQRCSMCDELITTDNPSYQECVYILNRMFPDIEDPQDIPSTITNTPSDKQTIMVSVMGGKVAVVDFDPNMTVMQLKKEIEGHFKIKPEHQRLLYHEKQFETQYNATLADHNVQPFSTINLVVVLYKIPESFDDVYFDLSWDFPTIGSDPVKEYLDASVLLYSGNSCKEVLDWRNRTSKKYAGVMHSGDDDNKTNYTGHQFIKVRIKSLPKPIDKLFFTLSAFDSKRPKRISMYPNPRLHFFDARDPNNPLCDDSLTEVPDSEAVIMCSMCKKKGNWQVLSLKRLCDGNSNNYDPIKETIQKLIKNGMS